ncbi:MAG TPA: hypothetical protein PL009_00690 [Flavipsychrobacter sp.]|nr:hypothetical protein [Flavipsychrobacter sp.]
MFRNNLQPKLVLTALSVIGMLAQASALPTVGAKKKALLKTTAGCDPATATIEMDINNVRARMMTGGDMWWNQGLGNAAYEVPKNSRRNALFAGSVWVGGFTADKQLKVCAQTYRNEGNDYWPGPLHKNAGGQISIERAVCSDWDRFWKVDRATINRFRELVRNNNIAGTRNAEFQSIWEWPAKGNGISGVMNGNDYSRSKGTSGLPLNMEDDHPSGYAPFVNNPLDAQNNPDIYEPERGDFPGDPTIGDLLGDQYIWWVFNDLGNTKGQTKTESIGMEVQTGAFAFASKDFMNDATFYNYRLINHSTSNLDSTFMATWTDADLGYAFDDYIGCDTVRGLGILYNGDGFDGAGEANSYGADIPMIGVDFFRGPHRYYMEGGVQKDSVLKMTAFTYFNNGADPRIGDPTNGVQVYNYMTGTSRNGQNFNNDFQGAGVPSTALGAGPDTRFVFFGDPDGSNGNLWSECVCQNPAFDRRFIHSAGPFTLFPGNVNDITIGAVWVSATGGCPNTSFKKIRLADDQAQALFDNNFKTIQGPEAPVLVKRELDNQIIFYLYNPAFSTNFQEKYGYETDSGKYRVKSLKAVNARSSDSLYKFEGYRVFQLKNNLVTPSEIFNERGELNTEVAAQVFQSDIRNGISQVVNWQKDINIKNCPDTCWFPVVKVEGQDSGIRHSFRVTEDAFAEGVNKKLVNYKTYYYVAIAYATNNFANFDPSRSESTQDIVYLESSQGAGGTAIQVIEAMPNKFSHEVGTDMPAVYESGVRIKKLEGIGNGGNFLELTAESKEEALSASTGYQSAQPLYESGSGPVNIKVIDPLKVVPGTWSLYILPDTKSGAPFYQPMGPDSVQHLVGSKAQWVLVKDGADTVMSERNIDVLNEQILAQYGLSVSIKQEVKPGDNQPDRNGLIGSRIEFSNTSITWLAGVNDEEQQSDQNWIRSGGYNYVLPAGAPPAPCNYDDNALDTFGQFYETLLSEYTFSRATWAPYSLAATDDGPGCFFGVAKTQTQGSLSLLHGVDIVFTSDTSKWSRSLVLETNNDRLGEQSAAKLAPRSHRSWNKEFNANGSPQYANNPTDTSFSWFPGYAVNVETGERLNIVFGEDSYLSSDNGRDMIWNPTSTILDNFGNNIWGGRHFVYVSSTKYDGCERIFTLLKSPSVLTRNSAYRSFLWMGLPTVNTGFNLLPLKDGLIPTETTLKLRVTRPYGRYKNRNEESNAGLPWYQFNTDAIAARKFSESGNSYRNDKQALLDRMHVVPNPYYASSANEANRIDTRVRIIGLPKRATISVYSLDGALIRKLDKDSDVSFIDWDVRNAKNLPIASGMYLIHVNAEGIGEKIIRWFGAMRPIDITQY